MYLQCNLENEDYEKTVHPWNLLEDIKIRDAAGLRQYKDMI